MAAGPSARFDDDNMEDEPDGFSSSSSDNTGTEDEDSDQSDTEYDPTWSNNTGGMRKIPFTGNTGLKVPVPGQNTPLDWFNLLFDENLILDRIVSHTNRYALDLFCSPATKLTSRITRWKDITVEELKIFIGLLLLMGIIKLNRLQDYWSTHRLFNFPSFREYMSRDRFLIILRCVNFSANYTNSNDRLLKVRELVDFFNNSMGRVYYPSRELSLDESMVLWRGRLLFRQYIKGKRHRYGIKLYTISEPEGMVIRFMVYVGRDDATGGKGHASSVVLNLMRGMLGNGHSLFMDNFYNSFFLASKLLANKTYCTGTLRINRKNNPPQVMNGKIKKNETICQYAEGVLIGKWKDKRVVTYISTEFENDMVQVINKRGEQKTKPKPIVFYNAHMKGVDRGDQMLSYYPCERKTIRWYKKIFIHILQMTTNNSWYFFNMHRERNKMPMYNFRMELIQSLLPPKLPMLPNVTTPSRNRPNHTLTQFEERDIKGDRIRKRCRSCYKQGKKIKRTTYTCSACPDKPGLCPKKCFDDFHRNM